MMTDGAGMWREKWLEVAPRSTRNLIQAIELYRTLELARASKPLQLTERQIEVRARFDKIVANASARLERRHLDWQCEVERLRSDVQYAEAVLEIQRLVDRE